MCRSEKHLWPFIEVFLVDPVLPLVSDGAAPSPGLSSNVVPMYLGEISPKNLRGAIGIVPQLFITVGILSAQVLGIRDILGNSTGLGTYYIYRYINIQYIHIYSGRHKFRHPC